MAGGRLLAFFQNFGSGELVVILLVALLVVGPERLPALARSMGKGLHKLRTMTDGMSSQVQDIANDPAMAPLRELGEFAARPRQKLAEYALEAEAEERFRQEQPETPPAAANPPVAHVTSGATEAAAEPDPSAGQGPASTTDEPDPVTPVPVTPDPGTQGAPEAIPEATVAERAETEAG